MDSLMTRSSNFLKPQEGVAVFQQRFVGFQRCVKVTVKRPHWLRSPNRVWQLQKMGVSVRASNMEEYREKPLFKESSLLDLMADNSHESSAEEHEKEEEANNGDDAVVAEEGNGEIQKKTEYFEKILDVPVEERNKQQNLQVIDRAGAAIAAASALLAEISPLTPQTTESAPREPRTWTKEVKVPAKADIEGKQTPGGPAESTPGPDFWSWIPPDNDNDKEASNLAPKLLQKSQEKPVVEVLEKDRSHLALNLPLESKLQEETISTTDPHMVFRTRPEASLPPFQSLFDAAKSALPEESTEASFLTKQETFQQIYDSNIAQHASEIASVMDHEHEKQQVATSGVNPDGSRWWKETGVEHRTNGVVCNWTVLRGVSSAGDLEWEDKFWEAYDEFDFKELGSEKCGRDAAGNVWREFWKEAMWQDVTTGVVHMEKSADKWAKDGNNGQWHEKWWEHYDAGGYAEKWADKWCQIDLNTPLEDGHAHVWHERWGEKFDGKGSCMKYTDKWAERVDGQDRWSKWGDKWDEHFDENGHGIKQGETWWQGPTGDKWNRTWGEGHNGSGWVHKYGKSSSGEHWDTREEQETWYERQPHFGFQHCYENSQELRKVGKPEKTEL